MDAELYVSVDLDGLHQHLRGYGVAREAVHPEPVLERALPRFLELFARLGVRATFFVVATDAAAGAAELRPLLAAGHEIGSHSLTHPLPFSSFSRDVLEREAAGSREMLEQLFGVAVRGFRAPGFGVSRTVLEAVAKAGYCYDASLLPSPAHFAAAVWLDLSRGKLNWISNRDALRFAFAPRRPHRVPQGIWELPLSVTPLIRAPLYHTPRLVLGRTVFRWLARWAGSGSYLHYGFHGIDLLDPDEIDPDLLHHPGGRIPLPQKTEIVAEVLAELLRGRRSRRLDELAALA